MPVSTDITEAIPSSIIFNGITSPVSASVSSSDDAGMPSVNSIASCECDTTKNGVMTCMVVRFVT